MNNVPLGDELAETVQHIETLRTRHHEGLEYVAVQARLDWLHTQVQHLYAELVSFKAEACAFEWTYQGLSGDDIWRKTQHDIRANQPASLRSPARAIVDAHLDLLHLVASIAHARAILRERHAWLQETDEGEKNK